MFTFYFEDDFPFIDSTTHVIKAKIFENETLSTYQLNWTIKIEDEVKCYNLVVVVEEE